MQSPGQLPAPGALHTYAGCRRSTCLWVPYAAAEQMFARPSYQYLVSAEDAFVLKKGDKVLLRTVLKDLSASVSVAWIGPIRSLR